MSSHARGSVGESSRDRAWVRARRCASAAGGGGRPRRGVGSVRAAPRAASGRTHQQHIAAAEPEEPRRRERQEDLPVDVLQRRLVTLVETRRDAVLLRRDRCRGTQTHADARGADAGMHGPRAWEGCVCACAWEGVRGPLGRRWRACDQTATRTVPTSGFMYVSVALLSRCSSCMVNRSEIVGLGGLWLEGHGLSVGSETLGPSSRVRRTAPSLQMQPDEPVVARYGATKTAI